MYEECVRAEVLVWDSVTSNSIESLRFILVIHHHRPTVNDADLLEK